MLLALHIENFALISRLELNFPPGLVILTGETGAGKSIIIDAVGVVLGGRAAAESIRTGAESALVEAVFAVDRNPAALACLQNLGFAAAADEPLLIAREINRAGKNTCRINGRLATTAMLREVSQYLIDIHGQHEHQSLLRTERHLEFLDYYGGSPLLAAKAEVRALFGRAGAIRAKMKKTGGDEKERRQKIDLLRFQQEEIAAAALREGEEASLAVELSLLANAEKLFACTARAKALLYDGSPRQPSVTDQIGTVGQELRNAARIDPRLQPLLEALESAGAIVDDVVRDLRGYQEAIEYDPERLAAVERRLDMLSQLKRKYGGTVEEIIAYGRQAAGELAELEHSGEVLAALQAELHIVQEGLRLAAAELSRLRREAAENLAARVGSELTDLGMGQAVFGAAFAAAEAVTADGIDRVEFVFSPNPGEPPKPLARIASGGEVSRVMLALKTVLADADRIPTLIFDEIDAGIGVRAAQAVARKLTGLAREYQVICITHLAQIASMADGHFAISKKVAGGRTETIVEVLDPAGRIGELARMLDGSTKSPITIEHARAMLAQAAEFKAGAARPVSDDT